MVTGDYSVEAARFTQDEQIVYLALCDLGGPSSTCDLYRGQRFPSDLIGAYSPIASSDPSKYDAYPTVTSDGEYLVFSSRRSAGFRTYVVKATQGQFTQADIVPLQVASDFSESNEPYLLGDGKTLYFSANDDLYRASGDAPEFGGIAGRTALTSLNALGWDAAPVVTNDELELFFSSDRGGGGLDIYTATRAAAEDGFTGLRKAETLSVEDIGPTALDQRLEWPVWISSDRCTLYYITKPGRTDTAPATLLVTSRRP